MDIKKTKSNTFNIIFLILNDRFFYRIAYYFSFRFPYKHNKKLGIT